MRSLLKFSAVACTLLMAISCQQSADDFASKDSLLDSRDRNAKNKPHVDNNSNVQGVVYTLSNQEAMNSVIAYRRDKTGELTSMVEYPTGGFGTGEGLGNQGAIQLSDDGQWLFAVDPGSDGVVVFSVSDQGLELVSKTSSLGDMPVSVANHGNLVYVLNAGEVDGIQGFTVDAEGQLTPIDGSNRGLSAEEVGPAQIGFNRNGTALIITEKATNLISTFPIDANGVPGGLRSTQSLGTTPFGFTLGNNNFFYVTEAGMGETDASTISAYAIDDQGNIKPAYGPLNVTETATCWIVTNYTGSLMYATNTGSNTVSGIAVDYVGSMELVDANGETAFSGSMPIDAVFSSNSEYLYVLNSGDDSITAYAVDNRSGALTLVGTTTGVPDGATGLAAR